MSVNVSALETGKIRVRPSQLSQSADRPALLRRAKPILGDRRWSEPLPINTFLIHHPDGPILFDTGESPRVNEKGWLPWWHPFLQRSLDIHVAHNEGIGSRLLEQGLSPSDLQAVVLSHLHHDHADGLGDVADAKRILVTREHWDAFRNPLRATVEGALPRHWPPNFKPELLQLTGPALGPWEKTYPITADGRVVGVPTPGHVPGHLSVVVFGDQATYFLGGDVTYDQALLDQEVPDGISSSPHLEVEQLRKIKEFAHQQPIVLLPAHDLGASARLLSNEVYLPSPLKP